MHKGRQKCNWRSMKAKNLNKVHREQPKVNDDTKQKVSVDECDSVIRTILSAPPIEKIKKGQKSEIDAKEKGDYV
jgi:hypothetical protein